MMTRCSTFLGDHGDWSDGLGQKQQHIIIAHRCIMLFLILPKAGCFKISHLSGEICHQPWTGRGNKATQGPKSNYFDMWTQTSKVMSYDSSVLGKYWSTIHATWFSHHHLIIWTLRKLLIPCCRLAFVIQIHILDWSQWLDERLRRLVVWRKGLPKFL